MGKLRRNVGRGRVQLNHNQIMFFQSGKKSREIYIKAPWINSSCGCPSDRASSRFSFLFFCFNSPDLSFVQTRDYGQSPCRPSPTVLPVYLFKKIDLFTSVVIYTILRPKQRWGDMHSTPALQWALSIFRGHLCTSKMFTLCSIT